MARNIAGSFIEQVRRALNFLLTDFAFEGYESESDTIAGWAWVRFYSPRMHAEVMLDPRERAIVTQVRLAGSQTWVDLDSLLAAAKVTLPKGLHARATSIHGLRVAVTAHAVALRVLVPRLNDQAGIELMRKAGIR